MIKLVFLLLLLLSLLMMMMMMEKIENCINKNPRVNKQTPNTLGERKQNQGNKTPKQEDNKKKNRSEGPKKSQEPSRFLLGRHKLLIKFVLIYKRLCIKI